LVTKSQTEEKRFDLKTPVFRGVASVNRKIAARDFREYTSPMVSFSDGTSTLMVPSATR